MIVYDKAFKIKFKKDNIGMPLTKTTFIRSAKINIRGEEVNQLIKDMEYLDLIKYDGVLFYLTISDKLNHNNNAIITIEDFDNMITYYNEYFKGWKYIECRVCGARVKKKKHSGIKYCKNSVQKTEKKSLTKEVI